MVTVVNICEIKTLGGCSSSCKSPLEMGQCASAHARFGDSGPCVGSEDLYLATGAAAGRADRQRGDPRDSFTSKILG